MVDFITYDTLFRNMIRCLVYVQSIQLRVRLIMATYLTLKIINSSYSNSFLANALFEVDTWDFFGVMFFNNVRLKHLLLDYFTWNYVLLKVFPVTGFIDLCYSNEVMQLVVMECELTSFNRFIVLDKL